jgi:Fe-Mn family superoxide dismutase
MLINRRSFLGCSATAIAALTLGGSLVDSLALGAEAPVGFVLPKLPYAFDALMPYIDAETMEIHHDRHHAAYVANLNKALAGYPDLLKKDPIDLVSQIDDVPAAVKQAVINNGGGHVNHSLFWQMMAPGAGGAPTGELAKLIDSSFGSFDKFQAGFTDAAMKRFGSGWAWLVIGKDGNAAIVSTANQDCPYMVGQKPLLGIDVWEHAYYLKYQNKRADYVKAWWNVVNWPFVAELHDKTKKA